MPMGIVVSQKIQVTGGLVGSHLVRVEAFLSGFGLAGLASELDGLVSFSCVALIL